MTLADRQTPATYVVLVEGEVVGGQHADAQAGAQSGVQEAPHDGLILWANTHWFIHYQPEHSLSIKGLEAINKVIRFLGRY